MDNNTRRQLTERAYELGYQFERNWGNCAQATMSAVQKTLGAGTENRPALQAISGFHGGGGGLCDGSCGAYIAGVYLIAERHGRDVEQLGADPEDPRAVKTTRALDEVVTRLHGKFIDEYGTVVCSDIHRKLYGRTFHLHDPDDREKFEAAGAHDWGCTSVVGKAAAWTVEIIAEHDSTGSPRGPAAAGGPTANK